MNRTEIDARAKFDFIRYASVWEDADILCEALRPSVPGGRILSIASAGDNVLAMLTLDPAEVVAVDLSEPQLAAVELRLVAFRALDRDALLAFLGITAQMDRGRTYASLRGALSARARDFWDRRPDAIALGAAHAGKFERFFGIFRRYVLPLVHGRRTVASLLVPRDAAGRERFYETQWDSMRWRFIFRLFFSRFVMGRLGRDPEFFAHVEGSVGDRILARTRHALTALETHSNPYLTYILTGNFAADALPMYLRPEHYATIRERLERVTLLHTAAEQAPGRFDGFNLSDIFEYMSPAGHVEAYRAVAALARPAARIAYWNLLAPRGVPDALRDRIVPLGELADALHQRDRAWFYGAFHVDEVARA
jgi:S-adenosylmethionine-diacylglycerol 3-amino-3-carboxypropyl transferase